MDGVLKERGLERKDLDIKCPRDIRDSIADEIIVDGYHVGRTLNVSDTRLNSIRRNTSFTEPKDKAVAYLDAWAEEHGSGATCLKLAEALEAHIKTSTLECLCEKVLKVKRESAASGPSSGSLGVSAHQPQRRNEWQDSGKTEEY